MSSYQISSGSASASYPASAYTSASGSASAAAGSVFGSLSGGSYSFETSSASASAAAAAPASRTSTRRSSRASVARGGNCGGCEANNVESEIERQILNATRPIPINETEEIEAIGYRGIYANRSELERWKGQLPLSEYIIYEDPDPKIIRKKVDEKLKYIQDIQVKYYKPPPQAEAGEIVIKQQPDVPTTPAPPLVIRKPVDAAKTPEPLVVREAPPCPPPPIPSKVITVKGNTQPPPPRKVVIEKLPPFPPKPQPLVIERWLPYDGPAKRKVVYDKPCPLKPPCPPKNLIIEWESGDVEIEKRIKHHQVIILDPVEYRRRYQFNKQRADLPELVTSIKSEISDETLSSGPSLPELEGDVAALKLVDLDKEGLSEYRDFINSITAEPTSSTGCQQSSSCGSAPSPSAVVVASPAPAPAPAPCGTCNGGNAFFISS